MELKILTELFCEKNGSTALVVIVFPEKITVINVGDSLAFGITKRGEAQALNL